MLLKRFCFVFGLVNLLFVSSQVFSANSTTHNLFVGRFTGDYIPDLFYQGKTPSVTHEQYYGASAGQSFFLLDSWLNGKLGINWDATNYKVHIGDFNYDLIYGVGSQDRASLFLQSQTPGTNYIAFPEYSGNANAGKFSWTMEIADGYLGINWNAQDSALTTGRFTSTGVTGLFVQGRNTSSTHYIAEVGANLFGTPNNNIKQTIANNYLSTDDVKLIWDAEHSVIHTGDFNGDGFDDLFLQVNINYILLPFDGLVIPIPKDGYLTSAILLNNQSGQFHSIHQAWQNGHLGIDWSANANNVVIGDFNGDGKDDIYLQARNGGSHRIVQADYDGKFNTISQTWSEGHLGQTWSGNSTQIVAADFNADGKADLALSTANGGKIIAADVAGQFSQGSDIWSNQSNVYSYPHRSGTVVAGKSAGGFNVGISGAAGYSMGVAVPPGMAGMAPSIGLNYSSQGGNGIMGMGWSLSGLSAIVRCPQSFAEDGQVRDIKFDNNDKLCLDGQRLVRVAGSAYGRDGAQYRTEIDTFSRITQQGGDLASGNATFKVETKAGQTYYYGTSNDSSINIASKTATYMWLVKTISDASGNTLTANYFEDVSRGNYRVESIVYPAGNGGAASVRFYYEDRPDNLATYVQGSPVLTDVRLAAIETYVDDAFVRSIEIYYNTSSATERSRIDRIQECANDGTCLPATNFGWNTIGTDWPEQHVATGLCANNDHPGTSHCYFQYRSTIQYADIDGDGRADMCYRDQTGIRCYKSNGNGFATGTPVLFGDVPDYSTETIRYVDINNDNKADLVYRADEGIRIHLSNGNGFGSAISSGVLPLPYGCGTVDNNDETTYSCNDISHESRALDYPDINGDARPDLCYRDPSIGIKCFTGNGAGSFTAFATVQNCTNASQYCNDGDNHNTIRYQDMNGDGLADIVYRDDYYGISYYPSTGSGFASRVATYVLKNGSGSFDPASIQYTDINGDGLTDVCRRVNSQGIDCYLNDGGGLPESSRITTGLCADANSCTTYTIRFVDLNLDGRADITFRTTGGIVSYLGRPGNYFEYNDTVTRCASPYPYKCESHDDNFGTIAYADVNGDGAPDQLIRGDNGVHLFPSSDYRQDFLTGITDGFGNQTDIQYSVLTDSTVYDTGTCSNAYPQQCLVGPMPVVKSYQASNGVGGMNDYTYRYQDMRTHLRGRGLLGFKLFEKTDVANNVTTQVWDENYTGLTRNDSYPDTYPYRGMGSRKRTIGPNGIVLSETSNTFDYRTTYGTALFPFYNTSTERTRNPDNLHISTSVIQNQYDPGDVAHGNLSRVILTSTDHVHNITTTKTTVNVYNDDEAQWHLARVANTSVTHTTTATDVAGNPVPPITKESGFTYRSDGLLETSTIEPNRPQDRVISTFGYDTYGNKNSVTVEGGQTGTLSYIAPRTTTTAIAPSNDFYYTVTTTNALNQSETKTVDARTGVVRDQTGPNGITTSWDYDGFGRKWRENRADGTATTISRARCNNDCPPDAVAYVVTQTDGQPYTTVFSDAVGREVLSLGEDIDGDLIYKFTEYNGKGQVTRLYDVMEAAAGTPVTSLTKPGSYIETTYDQFNRIHTVTDLLGNTSNHSYNALTASVTVTAADVSSVELATRTTSTTSYADGSTREVVDAAGGVIRYYYDVQGNLTATQSPGETISAAPVTITMQYDHKGRKTGMTDPNMGSWSYEYDALGQLRKQTDAKGNTSRMEYDVLGRQVLLIEPEGISKWGYDSAAYGIGKLAYMAGPIPVSQSVYLAYLDTPPDPAQIDESAAPFRRSHTYDSLGRGATATTTIEGISYEMATSYDNRSRVQSITYPRTGSNQRLRVSHTYDPADRGHLVQVDRQLYDAGVDGGGNPVWDTPVAGTQATVWKLGTDAGYVNALTKHGQIRFETYGNGLITDHYYDAHGRLTGRIVGDTTTVQNVGYVYDSLGNLEQRTDHLPDPSQGSLSPIREDFAYDELNRVRTISLTGLPAQTGPAITQFEYRANGNIWHKDDKGTHRYYFYESSRPHAVTRLSSDANGYNTVTNYGYDANGSMDSGDGRYIDYTSFNKPARIQRSDAIYHLYYNAEHTRYKKTGPHGTTYYLSARYDAGTHYEREIEDNGEIRDVHYLYGGTGLIGTYTVDHNAASKTRYFHKDHLGSISVITDETGTVRAKVGYTAFGQRTDGLDNLTEMNAVLDRVNGEQVDNHHWYTGHEHLDETGLIHMNGRVYDPALGRFLSADPHIQAPDYSQSYNRYSYVMNNPLNSTDPSGYFSLGDVIKAVVGGAVVFAMGPAAPLAIALDGYARKQSKTYRQAATIAAIVASAIFQPFAPAIMAYNSAMNAWAVGGDVHDIVRAGMMAAATTAAFASVGEASGSWHWTTKAFAHGMVGGMSAQMQGGSFGSGFIAAAVGKGLSEGTHSLGMEKGFGQGLLVAIGGGISSELGGGKFWDGAVTAGLAYAVNHLQYSEEFKDDIERIKNHPVGKDVINDLEESEYLYKVETRSFRGVREFLGMSPGASYDPQFRTIYMDANIKAEIFITDGERAIVNSDNILMHELGHAHRHDLKVMDFNPQNRLIEEMTTIRLYENPYGGYNRIKYDAKMLWE